MECYKITFQENTLKTTGAKGEVISSKEYMIRWIREVLKDLHKSPNSEIGVIFEETDSFPKQYYFISSNNAFLSKVKAKCILEPCAYPAYAANNHKYLFLGNKAFFPPTKE